MARTDPSFLADWTQLYEKHLWFRAVVLIILLQLAWWLGIYNGMNALIDAKDVVQRDVVYEHHEINPLPRSRPGHSIIVKEILYRGSTETLIIYFEDGTQAQTIADANWLKTRLNEFEQGTKLSVTLDASQTHLLSVRYGKETLLQEKASISLLNHQARMGIILGGIVLLSALAQIVRDVREGLWNRILKASH